MKGLADKVAIVAGAGARGDGIGNGRAAALLLAEAGCRVLAVDRDIALAERTVAMIQDAGGVAQAARANVTKLSDCEAVVAQACAAFGGVDLLDNNVGIGSTGTVVTEDPARWDTVMRVNVDSMVNMSRAVIPEMMRRGGGAIVNVSSISALRPRGLTAYSTSKGAVMALTKAMAVDHGGDGIRVNCVAPGPVFTPMVEGDGMSDERRATRKAATLLNVEGTGWDVGNAVMFLLSDAARYVTGQVLVVDGGVTLQGPSR
ncbi:MAG: SDR family NAD(P)-dependent oxidoreductase [Pseudomonadales bacterium]|jgi:NAD(P)-dependent dehydrogenase (short-subunit alcohol dehydrogenase family)|nr:SDR family NAD(P)-dependent oxidoreductase [Pseudomonadales bacterium]